MSSQGVNATQYSGFTTPSTGFPLRDGSDYTTMLRNRSIYRENTIINPVTRVTTGPTGVFGASGATGVFGASGATGATTTTTTYGLPYSIIDSNVYRLSYQFGRLQCGSCAGGGFPNANIGS